MVVRCGMSDKLISKKSLLKDLDSVIAQYNWKDDGVIMDILTCVRDMVFDQPTAYDIDKVVEKLEWYLTGWVPIETIYESIEIVKGGVG